MTTSTLTVSEFVLARIAEDEAFALSAQAAASIYDEGTVRWHWLRTDGTSSAWEPTLTDPARVLAQCAAMRKIVELHASWPILAQTQPDLTEDTSDPSSVTFRLTQQIAWATEQEYRDRFGEEPPTAPMIRALASIWSDHPDFREEWA
ncbi:MAG: DUF6221 family protein [Mycobacteriaceae bacterium]